MRVLLAEDEKKLASHIRNAFRQHGYAVDTVNRGDEAFELAQTTPYDAIVLDVMMPGRDGLSILRTLRERRITTPIILLTARGEVSERVEGLRFGADDYVASPLRWRNWLHAWKHSSAARPAMGSPCCRWKT